MAHLPDYHEPRPLGEPSGELRKPSGKPTDHTLYGIGDYTNQVIDMSYRLSSKGVAMLNDITLWAEKYFRKSSDVTTNYLAYLSPNHELTDDTLESLTSNTLNSYLHTICVTDKQKSLWRDFYRPRKTRGFYKTYADVHSVAALSQIFGVDVDFVFMAQLEPNNPSQTNHPYYRSMMIALQDVSPELADKFISYAIVHLGHGKTYVVKSATECKCPELELTPAEKKLVANQYSKLRKEEPDTKFTDVVKTYLRTKQKR